MYPLRGLFLFALKRWIKFPLHPLSLRTGLRDPACSFAVELLEIRYKNDSQKALLIVLIGIVNRYTDVSSSSTPTSFHGCSSEYNILVKHQ